MNMREVPVTEARVQFFALIRAIERGESFAITRNGKPVAHLVPAEVQDRASRKKAVEEFRRRRAQWRPVDFSVEEFLAARHEGHRF